MKYARGLSALAILLCGVLVWAQPPAAAPGAGKGNTTLRGPGTPHPAALHPPIKRTTNNIKVIVSNFGPVFFPGPPVLYGSTALNSSITIVTPPPSGPTVVIASPPSAVPPQSEMDLVNPIIFRPRPKQIDEAPLPGEPAGGFRPVRPEDRRQAQQPVPPAGKAEEKRPPMKERPPRPPEPELKPKDEATRQLDLGKKAFAAQEYGRAAERFQEAARVAPEEPLAYFLLAQAYFALGQYREATAAIHEGLRRKPDWPTSDFRPIELYGANVADYAEHLELLRQTLNQNPQDPVLLFLNAYQLWFDGRQDEARLLFRKALPLVAEPRFLNLFLDAQGRIRVVFR